jgi:ABC-type spermidine/putrescine transport system permease subunit I
MSGLRGRAGLLLFLPATMLVSFAFLVPLGHLVVFSFWRAVPGSNLPDRVFSLNNYERILTDPYYLEIYLQTIRISIIATSLSLLLGFPLALYISRQQGMKKGVLMVLVLLPTVGGGLIQALGWIVLLLPFGVVNGTLLELNLISRPMRLLGNDVGIILGLTQAFMPMMVLPIVAVLGRIDQSLARAATSLGASPWRVFREVTWPLSRPGVVAGTVLVFMAHLTSFVTPLLLGQGKIQTYSTVAYQQAVEVLDYPFASAFALFPFVVVFGIWGLWVIASPGVRRLRGADAGGLGV